MGLIIIGIHIGLDLKGMGKILSGLMARNGTIRIGEVENQVMGDMERSH